MSFAPGTEARARGRGAWVRALLPALAVIMATQISTAQSSSRLVRRTIDQAVPKPILSGAARFVRPIASQRTIAFTVALQPPHPAREEAFLQSLQDRKGPNFHRYLTPVQWDARFAPTPGVQNQVVKWLGSQGLGIVRLYPNRLIVDAAGPSVAVDRAFGVRMGLYQGGGLRTLFYSNDRNPLFHPSCRLSSRTLFSTTMPRTTGCPPGVQRGGRVATRSGCTPASI